MSKTVNDEEQLLNLDELLSNESICQLVEKKLKHTPQSDFIYNKKLPENLKKLAKRKVIDFAEQLYADHYIVCRENEQYRTMNFKLYLKLKKLGVE